MANKKKIVRTELCKYHYIGPEDIAFDPKNCWVCRYFEEWHEIKKNQKKWYQFWK